MATSQVKDYYAILGAARTADAKALKAAFRKQARKFHPDVNKSDRTAEERFKEVNEAYDVLSDPASRKLYDRYGADWQRYRDAGFTGDEPAGSPNSRRSGFGQSSDAHSVFFDSTSDVGGFTTLFDDLLANRRGGRFGTTRQRKVKGEDIDVSVEISFDEAFRGATRRLDVQSPEECKTCNGAGFVKQSPCPTCDATGTVLRNKTIEVKIPAGVATGSRVRIAGQGGAGNAGGAHGDVWLNVSVRADPRFERSGDDLKEEIEISLYTAVLGGETVVHTPTGKVALSVPAGSQNGRVFRLRGQGMPKLKAKNGERGDLLARIKVGIPTSLSEREEKLFQELRAIRGS